MAETKANARSSRDSQSHDNSDSQETVAPSYEVTGDTPCTGDGYTYQVDQGIYAWDRRIEQMSRAESGKAGNS